MQITSQPVQFGNGFDQNLDWGRMAKAMRVGTELLGPLRLSPRDFKIGFVDQASSRRDYPNRPAFEDKEYIDFRFRDRRKWQQAVSHLDTHAQVTHRGDLDAPDDPDTRHYEYDGIILSMSYRQVGVF